jgi:hypothetical protein
VFLRGLHGVPHQINVFLTPTYEDVSYEFAVATAAYLLLRVSFPGQDASNEAYETTMKRLKRYVPGTDIEKGQLVGETTVDAHITNRTNDQSCPLNRTYVWQNAAGQHQPNPLNPKQRIAAPNYGDVTVLVKIF